MTDEYYMRMALELAERGRGTTSPNPMVGAVVVAAGAVVGSGYHRFAGGPHAEVSAIDAAGVRAAGATLYVSLEPCTHTGRTPPCTRKILEAGIRRVVVGMRDPNPRAAGGAEVLRREGVEVTLGVCAAEAEELNEAFATHIRTGRPFVTAKCAATLDGRIATRTLDSKWVTGERARAYVHALRYATDAILVGAGTIAADDPLLTARVADREPRDPVRIVLDATLRIDPAARVLNHGSASETWVIAGRGAPLEARVRIERPGVRVLEAETRDGLVALAPLMAQLGGMGVTSLLIEGGGRVLSSAFRAGIVDKVCFFYAPLILGGDDGVPICSGPGAARMQDCLRLERVRTRRFDDDVLIEGYVGKTAGSGS
jgi:diaminohydroxyphosphoribosylaminopyrimidine deaminase / 5-amino-6-(5-phosphoribosylamino)uracil reductase